MTGTGGDGNSIRRSMPVDQILASARSGDAEALDALLGDLLSSAPARTVTAYRDGMIRNIGGWLQTAMPSSRPAAIATVLCEAGRSLQTGRGITSRYPFHLLSNDERWRLRTDILSILAFSPRWPKKRQMISVLFPDRAI